MTEKPGSWRSSDRAISTPSPGCVDVRWLRHPRPTELEGALFTEDQPAIILGDPARGVVAVVECEDGPHVRLLVVDKPARGQGDGPRPPRGGGALGA